MKKLLITILIIAIGVGGTFGYIKYKKHSTKIAVEKYLTEDKNIEKRNIEKIEPFIANLQGDKKWMVYVKLKGDEKSYYYYKDSKKDKVILESYVLNGEEH
ncbi:hypothetical protein [Priestia endophytica]|uniref:hypothetical protein n=1 Tax=Priestia endophytica TaxID=135735 RepID=UPI000DCA689B|nr:hypothetical protein [Priestia endophytica]RAS87265.1 hypothetical protein A4U60_06740 [Priestia endophytica]